MKYYTGALENPRDERDIPVSAVQAPVKVPSSYMTDISHLPVNNQRATGSCVGQALSKIIEYYEGEQGKNNDLSARFVYAMSKLIDGYSGWGTYPRVAATVLRKQGVCSDNFINDDPSVGENKFRTIKLTGDMLEDALPRTVEGYAFVRPTIEAMKQAIYQNGLIAVSLRVGDWSKLPVTHAPGKGLHYVVVYGYEERQKDVRFFFRNSWGERWGDNGDGYFDFNDYRGEIRDILVLTEIPKKVLEDNKKKWDFKYFKPYEVKGVKHETVAMLDKARGIAGIPFVITSGYRSEAQNAKVGGVKGSSHTSGYGVDIRARNASERYKIAKACIEVGFNRVGVYTGHIHVDNDPSKTPEVLWNGNYKDKPAQSMNKLIASSSNPEKLSASVQGMLMSLVPLAIALLQVSGIEVSQGQLVELIQQLTAVISALVMAFGLIRKFLNMGKEVFVKGDSIV